VNGDDGVEPGAAATAHEQLLVVELLEIGLGRRGAGRRQLPEEEAAWAVEFDEAPAGDPIGAADAAEAVVSALGGVLEPCDEPPLGSVPEFPVGVDGDVVVVVVVVVPGSVVVVVLPGVLGLVVPVGVVGSLGSG
jgi:hypothetical protein